MTTENEIEKLQLELVRANERQLDHEYMINRMNDAENKCNFLKRENEYLTKENEYLTKENKSLKRKLNKKVKSLLLDIYKSFDK